MDWTSTRRHLQRIQDLLDNAGHPDAEDRERLLVERARHLMAPDTLPDSQSHETILVVRAGADHYGIPLRQIAGAASDVQRTMVPGAPPYVAGLIQVRGDIWPLYRLDALLDASHEAHHAAETVLLLRGGGSEFAVLAGEIEEVRQVGSDGQRPPPPGVPYALWATEDLIPVIDITSLWGKER